MAEWAAAAAASCVTGCAAAALAEACCWHSSCLLREGEGRWLGIRADQLARSRHWFQRHGSALVFWGRLVPGVRTLVSVPAGIERMPQGPFLVWTTAGSLVWTLLLTLAGKGLGQGYERVQGWLAPWAHGFERGLVLALAVGVVIGMVRLVWQRHWAE